MDVNNKRKRQKKTEERRGEQRRAKAEESRREQKRVKENTFRDSCARWLPEPCARWLSRAEESRRGKQKRAEECARCCR
jgi:hypothetical protein